MRGKKVGATHGGKSTGPKTEQGKANLKHGKYTKQAQTEHSEASAQLSQLEDAMYLLGLSKEKSPDQQGFKDFVGLAWSSIWWRRGELNPRPSVRGLRLYMHSVVY